MIYGKHPFERNGVVTSETIIKEPLKFNSKTIVSEQLKELLASMLEKNPNNRLPISKLTSQKWFEFSDNELKDTVQQLVDARNKILKRKEYLLRKAALRGNKFVDDIGKVIIMN